MGGDRVSGSLRWLLVGLAAAGVVAAIVLFTVSGTDSGEAQPTEAAAPTPNVVQAGAPGEPSRTLSKDELEQIEPPKHTAADAEFARGMIHHHEQALEMTGFVPGRGTGRDIRLLAERMKLSQEAEIELLERWLSDRDEAVPGAHEHASGHGGELMPGMLTEAELARLEAAAGTRFNRLFVRFMIHHHEGALVMVRQLRDANGGMEPEMDKLAREIEADQSIEINRMRQLLARL
jgi:uncharacterized protein (DUF305 family)